MLATKEKQDLLNRLFFGQKQQINLMTSRKFSCHLARALLSGLWSNCMLSENMPVFFPSPLEFFI